MARTRTRTQPEQTDTSTETPVEETQSEVTMAQPTAEVEETSNNKYDYVKLFEGNNVLQDMATKYLTTVHNIQQFNSFYSGKPEGEWNPNKLLREAKNTRESDWDANSLLEEYERLNQEVTAAKNKVAQHMATKLGVELSPEVPKPTDEEKDGLKEQRSQATEIGKSMQMMSTILSDENTKNGISQFLKDNPLPSVGSEKLWDPTDTSSTAGGAKKHRVDVRAEKDGVEVLPLEQGFTKAANAITKRGNLHERGKSPKADDFRKVWESNGEKDTSFEQDGVTYFLTARK